MTARSQVILVLGMHRSGTSALTRVLNLCGADLPDHLLAASPDINETGFWESAEIVALHDEILAAAGSSWDDVLTFPESWFGTTAAASFRQRLSSLLTRQFDAAPLLAIKDPRLCRLMPLWLPVLAELGIEPRVVIPVRNPLEIAASLNKREGFSEGTSLLLWLRHFLAAERDSRGIPRYFVLYDQLLADWPLVMGRIGAALGIAWPRRPDEAAPDITAFLSDRLRHHVLGQHAVFARADLPPSIKDAYGWALGAAENPAMPADLLDRIHDDIIHAEPVFAPAIRALQADAKRQSGDLRHWIDAAVERYAIIEQMRDEIAALRAQIDQDRQRAD